MRRLGLTMAVVVVVLALVVCGFFLQQQSSAAVGKVQYKVVSISTSGPSDAANLERTLNQLGAEDWEVVLKDGPLYVFRK